MGIYDGKDTNMHDNPRHRLTIWRTAQDMLVMWLRDDPEFLDHVMATNPNRRAKLVTYFVDIAHTNHLNAQQYGTDRWFPA